MSELQKVFYENSNSIEKDFFFMIIDYNSFQCDV